MASERPSRRSSFALVRAGVALLTRREAAGMIGLFLLTSLVGVLDGSVVILVVPLVQTIIDPGLLQGNPVFARLAETLGIEWSAAIFPWLAGTVSVLIAVTAAASLFVQWLVDRQAAKCRDRVGREFVTRLVAAPFPWFAMQNTAVLARQMFADIRTWRQDFLQSLLLIAQSAILIAFPAAVAIVIAPSRGLLALAAVCGTGILLVILIRPHVHNIATRTKACSNATMRILMQILTGIREVKVSNRSDFFIDQFQRQHHEGNLLQVRTRFLAHFSPTLILTLGQIGFIATAVVMWSAGMSGAEVAAQLAMLGVVVSRVLPAINKAAGQFNTLVASLPFVDGLIDLLAAVRRAELEFGRPAHGAPVPAHWRRVRFERVNFRYPNADGPSVNDLSVELERGKRYGVVGSSGAGKSTMVNLLLGLLQPTNGAILVDGRRLADLDLGEWQERIGYVPQDVFMVDDTLRANIAFGEPPERIDPDRLAAAVEQARLSEVVAGLPKGLDTQMGERGRRLSGGQAQRVAIARALYRRPDVVLLDEATSALDTMTELDIQASFDALGGNVLAIAVAHRVSSLRNCHAIIVLEGGRVQDVGSYEALLERNELFRRLAAQAWEVSAQ